MLFNEVMVNLVFMAQCPQLHCQSIKWRFGLLEKLPYAGPN